MDGISANPRNKRGASQAWPPYRSWNNLTICTARMRNSCTPHIRFLPPKPRNKTIRKSTPIVPTSTFPPCARTLPISIPNINNTIPMRGLQTQNQCEFLRPCPWKVPCRTTHNLKICLTLMLYAYGVCLSYNHAVNPCRRTRRIWNRGEFSRIWD